MAEFKQIFADPRIDGNFKYLFGPQNKQNMLNLLGMMIPEAGITDITYLETEQVGVDIDGIHSRYDLCCQCEGGSKCIVEMQKIDQPYFNYRSLLYSTYLIQRQAREEKRRQEEMYKAQGKDPHWNYMFLPVYMIGILDKGSMPTVEGKLMTAYRLKEISSGEDMNVEINFLYLHLDALTRDESEISDALEMFAYSMRNMHKLLSKPENFTDRRLDNLYDSATIRNDSTLKIDMSTTRNDYLNAIDWAEVKGERKGYAKGVAKGEAKGRAEGRAEGRNERTIEVARNLKKMGLGPADIAAATGLGEDEVAAL